ncbi:MAG: Bug family tripartite tricarboxylate transporter substrate binding protein [Lautropia sp.]
MSARWFHWSFLFGAALAVALAGGAVRAQAGAEAGYPARSVRVVVPFAPGGPADTAARKLTTALSAELGATFVVDNRPGGGGVVAASAVIGAPPDGYTVLFGAVSGLAFTKRVNPVITYDARTELTPISLTYIYPVFFVVNASRPERTLAEFVAMAKSATRPLNFGSAGTGTTSHLCVEALKAATGIEIAHVPYRGSSLAITDLLADRLDLMCDAYPGQKPHVEAGKVRVLAVAGETRSKVLPSAPAAPESQVPGLAVSSWFALMAPAGTPPAIRERLAAAIAKVQATPDMQAWALSVGVEAVATTPAQLARFIDEENVRWEKLITARGISLQ